MTLQNRIVCQKTDCLSYGERPACYSTMRLQDDHCKLYLNESDIQRINGEHQVRVKINQLESKAGL